MIAYLSLGSNIGNKKKHIETAISMITDNAGKIIAVSKMYKTLAWGFKSENFFLNNAIKIKTDLNPQELLSKIHEIENALGRKHYNKGYADRIIDIDILFYETKIIDEPDLKIPHSLLQQRNFVLYPLNDIAPNFVHPVLHKTVNELIKICIDTTFCELI